MAEGIQELDEEQQIACTILEQTSRNVFVTGKAGTGKSFLLKYFKKNTAKSVIVLAPTGVSAIQIGGQTLHSFFAFDHHLLDPAKVVINRETAEILKKIDAFIIDEISMVRADVMECVNRKFQAALGNDLPFGGKQLIAFGDLYQMEPIAARGEPENFLRSTYGGKYFFSAPVMGSCDLVTLELKSIYRQKEAGFQELLNEVRTGSPSMRTIHEINRGHGILRDPEALTIATTNRAVNEINEEKLEALPGKVYTYHGGIAGDPKECIRYTVEELRLKVGARVMLLRNNWQSGRLIWANGTLGEVVELTDDSIRVRVGNRVHLIERVTWDTTRYRYDVIRGRLVTDTVAQFTQYPLCLGWAMTIHKAQGKTFSRLNVDFGEGAFAHGQAYVALSRCDSLEGLSLSTPLRKADVIVNPEVVRFMEKTAREIIPLPESLEEEPPEETFLDEADPIQRDPEGEEAGGGLQNLSKEEAVPGAVVDHALFGEGQILEVMDWGYDVELQIQFQDYGMKTLYLSREPLEPIGGELR